MVLPLSRSLWLAAAPTLVARPEESQRQANFAKQTNATAQNTTATGKLDSATISKITDAEKSITGQEGPVSKGPTAQAQSHAGEPITSEALHDITEGEKKVTGGERVKGGPTATAQSILGKSRDGGN